MSGSAPKITRERVLAQLEVLRDRRAEAGDRLKAAEFLAEVGWGAARPARPARRCRLRRRSATRP